MATAPTSFPSASQQPYGASVKSYVDTRALRSNDSQVSHAPAFGWFFPEAEGAVGNGTTDDRAAFAAAVTAASAGGQIVTNPTKTYVVDAAWTISKAVSVVGGATLKKGSTVVSGTWITLNASGAKIDGITIDDSAGKVTGVLIAINGGFTGCRVSNNTILSVSSIVVSHKGGTGHRIENNTITGCDTFIKVNSANTGTKIIGNIVTGWSNRGIWVISDASGAASGIQIIRNDISGMVTTGAGTSRYPILIQANGFAAPDGALVKGNRVTGIGHSYNDATTPGNADCIALQGCNNARVIGNTATDGGDMGITIGISCVNVTVADNILLRNDTGGITINASQDVSIGNNVCKNNGQNRNSDRSAVGRAGIILTSATNVSESGNTLGDDQGTKTQQYGVVMTACTNVYLGSPIDSGNALALRFKNGGANTSIVAVTTAAF